MRALLLLATTAAISCGDFQASQVAPARSWTAIEHRAKLDDARITESSGIAESPLEPGVFYTHNDSGDSARLFKFDLSGKVLAEIKITNAHAIDWEDMAAGTIAGKPYLFIGDIGDNAGKRDAIVIYRVPEKKEFRGSVDADQTYTVSYPDGPHNAETLMLNQISGEIYVVTKAGKRPSLVFKFLPKGTGKYTLEKVGEISLESPMSPGRQITGGDISGDAKHVILRTYLGAYEYAAGKSFDDWTKSAPLEVKTAAELQGEAICYRKDGKSLVTTSELRPCPIGIGKLSTSN